MTKKDLPHVIALLLVTLVVENFFSAAWDNALVSGRGWFPGVAQLVEALFFVVLFVPVGFVLARLVQSNNPTRLAACFGAAYGALSLLLYRHSTTSSDPFDLFFFYGKYAFPALGAWFGALISAHLRRA